MSVTRKPYTRTTKPTLPTPSAVDWLESCWKADRDVYAWLVRYVFVTHKRELQRTAEALGVSRLTLRRRAKQCRKLAAALHASDDVTVLAALAKGRSCND